MGGLVGDIKGNNAITESSDGSGAGLQFGNGDAEQLFGILADVVGKTPDGVASETEVNGLSGQLSQLVGQADGKLKISDIKDVRLQDAARIADSFMPNAQLGGNSDGYLTQNEITNIQNATIKKFVGSDQAGWQTPQ